MIGDDLTRIIESAARADADNNEFKFVSLRQPTTYWDKVYIELELTIYAVQYQKRIARNERKKSQEK